MPPLMCYNNCYFADTANSDAFVSSSSSSSSSSDVYCAEPLVTFDDDRTMTEYHYNMLRATKKRRLNHTTAQQQLPSSSSSLFASSLIMIPKKKSVSFAPCAMTYSSDRTEGEITSSWYSKEELMTLKNERKEFVSALKKANWELDTVVNTSQHCVRGFEMYFSLQTNRETRNQRSVVRKNVLKEQRRQRRLQITDCQSLRRVASQATQSSTDKAIELGTQDYNDSLLTMPFSYESYNDLDDLDFDWWMESDMMTPNNKVNDDDDDHADNCFDRQSMFDNHNHFDKTNVLPWQPLLCC